MDPRKLESVSSLSFLAAPPFEREARSMCDEYSLEATPEQVARFARRLAYQQYKAEVAPLNWMIDHIAAHQPIQAIHHEDGKVTLMPREISPTEQRLREAISQAWVRAFGPGN